MCAMHPSPPPVRRTVLARPLALLTSPALRADQEAALFSLKCLVAAVLGLYVSLWIGLTRPFWVIGTVYLVSQPMSGATLSRGLFRLLGTLGGAAATVLLVPRFANEPLVLSVVLAAWMGLCLYLAMLDRTPRAYAFLLAGYTTSLIGFPSVMAPEAVFSVAVMRVQEISLGILAATLVHALLLPRPVSRRVKVRVAAILADAERWTRDMRAGATEAVLAEDRAKVAVDLLELHTLAVHLRFDSAYGVTQAEVLRALHDRMLDVLVLSSGVEDAMAALRAPACGCPAARGSAHDTAEVEEAAGVDSWQALLSAGLAADLAGLDVAHRDCRLLEHQLGRDDPHWRRQVPARLAGEARGHVLHRDHRLALRSALGAFIGIVLSCVVWIATGWSDGATAVSIIGTACVLFGTTEAPAGHVMRYLAGSAIGVAVGLVYGLAILPGMSGFVGLAVALAPALLLSGAFLARPAFTLAALGVVLTFPLVAGLGATNAWDFVAAVNSSVALLVGVGVALCSMLLFQTLDTHRSRRRLQAALRHDVARRMRGGVSDVAGWRSRMVDRLGLLAPRLRGQPGASQCLRAGFAALRAADVVAELRCLGSRSDAPTIRRCHAALIDAVIDHCQRDTLQRHAPDTHLLDCLDRARGAVLAGDEPERTRLLLLLAALRRDVLAPLIAHGD